MDVNTHQQLLASLLNGIKTGSSIQVKKIGGQKILRVAWLNILHDPKVFQALAKAIADDVARRNYVFDAIASIETSGAKYGIALSYELGKPYFSIHKAGKVVFEEPLSVDEKSVTEDRMVTLYLDRAVASTFKRVLLVDDIRRSSRTLNAAVDLLGKCNVEVVACYVILDLAFAGHPLPSKIPPENYHPLFVIGDVDDRGRCSVVEGLVPRQLGQMACA
ncbi:MAG: phosphoribosyltransferase family protein [Candidatus Caldarchaeum sp.]|uniref:Phosphoribosyltransferase domain-containing protein n=1 Tax=Caldiarchaeum subterraneum TaxID=311458 RepID=A0A7C5LCT5_CALS0